MRFIGIMSGTSMDAVDACLLQVDGSVFQCSPPHSLPIPVGLRTELMALQHPGQDELHRAYQAATQLTDCYAEACARLLEQAGLQPSDITAIGAHGQTVRHRPELGYTVQLLNGARLAVRSGIDVICDFRSADVAAGGQGAPLVPGFHRVLFGLDHQPRAALNLGGFANLSFCSGGSLLGFDTGPANALLDAWIERHQGRAFDADGAWAASGTVDQALLNALWAHPFFHAAFPKSTGRDSFHLGWLDQILEASGRSIAPQDVQASLTALSARAVIAGLQHAERHRLSQGESSPNFTEVVVCGGGIFNQALMRGLEQLRPDLSWLSSDPWGVSPMAVEACAFAWLARARCEQHSAVAPSVTGASHSVISGAWHRRP